MHACIFKFVFWKCLYRGCFKVCCLLYPDAKILYNCWCRFLADMIISFHKSYLDQFCCTVDIIHFVHHHYFKNPQHFFLDAISNAPLEIACHALSQRYAVKLNIMFYVRLNRVLRMYRMNTIFYTWEIDIRCK